jgi:fructose-bisphosphate aldolase, class II
LIKKSDPLGGASTSGYTGAMPLTLPEIRRNCQRARARMEQARAEKWAFGAFNLDDEATLKAVVFAAAAKNAPVLVEVSQGEVDDIGLDNVRDMVDNFKYQYGVEIYVNLDHSPSVEAAKDGIEAGFEFIHIDVSQSNHDAPDEEIIAATREVVEYAQLTGALVESEPHYFGGSSNVHEEDINFEEIKKTFSTPEDTRAFVEATGIDTFAAAIGNLHGKYPVPKVLDLELLQRLRDAVDCNISLHGGSGTPGHYFKDAVAIGVTKININSDMRYAYRTTLEKVLKENPKEFSVSKLISKEVVAAVQAVVESKIDDFNSAGRALV